MQHQARLTANPKESEGAKKPARCHVPESSLSALHAAHNNGALKYGHFNWRATGVDVQTYLSACERHIEAFKLALGKVPDGLRIGSYPVCMVDGGFDEVDPVTGIRVPHLGAAMASLSVMHDALMYGMLTDNYTAPEVLIKPASSKPVTPSPELTYTDEEAQTPRTVDDSYEEAYAAPEE